MPFSPMQNDSSLHSTDEKSSTFVGPADSKVQEYIYSSSLYRRPINFVKCSEVQARKSSATKTHVRRYGKELGQGENEESKTMSGPEMGDFYRSLVMSSCNTVTTVGKLDTKHVCCDDNVEDLDEEKNTRSKNSHSNFDAGVKAQHKAISKRKRIEENVDFKEDKEKVNSDFKVEPTTGNYYDDNCVNIPVYNHGEEDTMELYWCPDCKTTIPTHTLSIHVASILHQLHRTQNGHYGPLTPIPVFGLPSYNKGFQLLRKLGWAYTGLGKDEKGRTALVGTRLKSNRLGVGYAKSSTGISSKQRKITHSNDEVEETRSNALLNNAKMTRKKITMALKDEKEKERRIREYFGRYL